MMHLIKNSFLFVFGGERGNLMWLKEKSFFFFFLEAKENNYASCELSFTCILFLCDVGKFGILHGASVFQTGNCLLWRWYMMLFWATRALVNISFPVCHRGYPWEVCTEDLKIENLAEDLLVLFLLAGFFPSTIRVFVLQILFSSDCRTPFLRSAKLFFLQEEFPLPRSLCLPHWYWWFW